jgi:Uma2 family endonuclease
MAIQEKRITIAQYEAFLRENPSGLYELIDGEIVEKMVTQEHGVIAVNIATEIKLYLRKNPIGHVAVEARFRPKDDDTNDRLPDISVHLTDETPVTKGAVQGLPDLAIEIKSPDDTYRFMRAKADFYLENGSKLVWLIFPDKHFVEVYQKDKDIDILLIDDTLDGGNVLPDFELAVSTIFE